MTKFSVYNLFVYCLYFVLFLGYSYLIVIDIASGGSEGLGVVFIVMGFAFVFIFMGAGKND